MKDSQQTGNPSPAKLDGNKTRKSSVSKTATSIASRSAKTNACPSDCPFLPHCTLADGNRAKRKVAGKPKSRASKAIRTAGTKGGRK